ncbi:hypothetical protein L1987_38362 [Smallanthus sonchifolius]|uniref:Uncharacterized protein n=1 Tax=Smallanthus sonchifolius TaxID=185202 RepID=A0ACB9HIZ7_9ASTR|nr:hypothetical protein L1987_38362 [Smallanthus sonchifolius]
MEDEEWLDAPRRGRRKQVENVGKIAEVEPRRKVGESSRAPVNHERAKVSTDRWRKDGRSYREVVSNQEASGGMHGRDGEEKVVEC